MCTGPPCSTGSVASSSARTRPSAEHWLHESGIETTVLHDERCQELMRRLQEEKPDLWAEDIEEHSARPAIVRRDPRVRSSPGGIENAPPLRRRSDGGVRMSSGARSVQRRRAAANVRMERFGLVLVAR